MLTFILLLLMGGTIEGAVAGLAISNPAPGQFDIQSTQLQTACHSKYLKMSNVLAFVVPLDRLPDLIAGEEARAQCTLLDAGKNTHDRRGGCTGKSYICRAGKLKKKADQAKVGEPDPLIRPGTLRVFDLLRSNVDTAV
jgi:hypothetical protein